jgi:hypothetical protein
MTWAEEDQQYIDQLMDFIEYINQRLVVRSLEGHQIRTTLSEVVDLLMLELEQCKEQHRRDYGNTSGRCIFTEPEENPGRADSGPNVADNITADAQS